MWEIKNWLESLLDSMLIEGAEVEVSEDEEGRWLIEIKVAEEDSGILIGYRGDTLTAVQRLVRIIFGERKREEMGTEMTEAVDGKAEERRIVLNINNYRAEREERLRQSAVNAAYKVMENGGVYRMHGLAAAERFIVHDEISNNPDLAGIKSFSEGMGQSRTLVIKAE